MHPMVVHFPLALVLSGNAMLLASRLLRRSDHGATLATVGTWNLCLGAAAALFALGTGLGAAVGLQIESSAHQAVSVHFRWAIATSLALVLLAVWRGAGSAPPSRPTWVFLALLSAASAGLIVTGYRGGQNVYQFGVGVRGSPAAACGALDAVEPRCR